MQLNIRIEFADIFNRAAMRVPTSTNATPQPRSRMPPRAFPTAGFGFVATGNEGAVSNVQIPTSRQGTVVARITF